MKPRLTPPEVLRIRAGWFEMGLRDGAVEAAVALCRMGAVAGGSTACTASRFWVERPARRVFVPAFGIDRTEVSNRAYRRCQLALACDPLPVSEGDPRIGRPEQPAVMVTAREAERYCAWAGGRLPTEAEWERAARGGSLRSFPWGRFYNSRVANHGTAAGDPDPIDGYAYAAPVDAFASTPSAHGALNMAGNVWEWTADGFREDAYGQLGPVNPSQPADAGLRAIRGGSWRSPAYLLRATARVGLPAGERRADVGFRCAY